jgi:hypothetical protein
MTRRSWILIGGGLALLVAVFATQVQVSVPSRPSGSIDDLAALRERGDLNVVFILIDTLRADRLSAYGYARPTSPTLADAWFEFNQAVRHDIPFDASKTDGRCTEGIQPRKSNWAQRIDEPPFQAFPVTGGITFTFGGLEINGDAQALNTGGQPIRGLFASGDIIGLFFHNYPSCTGQTRNVVFSRLAGRHAAAQGL